MKDLYTISVIMPIYNTEKYLREAIDSVIKQTLDFRSNTQLILLDDASNDMSVCIAREYVEQYPDNIVLVCLEEHVGVGAIRNRGLELVEGKYTTFLDSDDKWSLNAFEEAAQFFEKCKENIELVFANCDFFDVVEGPHITNIYRDENSIVDIYDEYDKIKTMLRCFIKSEVAKLYRFNEKLLVREDTVFVNSVILRRKKYGMLSKNVHYFYRRRQEANSVMNTYRQVNSYFENNADIYFELIYSEVIKQAGQFLPMMQMLVAYDIIVRFVESAMVFHTLKEDIELLNYFSQLRQKLLYIEDKYILEAPCDNSLVKSLLIAYKQDDNIAHCFLEFRNKNRERQVRQMLTMKCERMNENCKLLKSVLRLSSQNKAIVKVLREKGYKRIAIYGFAEVGVWLYKELKTSDITVAYAIDRRASSLKAEINIIQVEEHLPEVDVIVVTVVNDFFQIREMLQFRVNSEIMNIKDLLSELEEKVYAI